MLGLFLNLALAGSTWTLSSVHHPDRAQAEAVQEAETAGDDETERAKLPEQ
jgi:hypothetical protein